MRTMPTTKLIQEIKNLIAEEKSRLEKEESKLNNNLVAGLDFSKSCPGICILSKEAKKIIYKDKFKEKENTDFYFRMIEIKKWLGEILRTFKPSEIMLEAPFISPKTARSNTILLRTHGYIGHYIMSLGIKINMIAPSSARAFLKIKPNKKEKAFEYVKEHFPELQLTDFKKDNDIADSVIVALSHYNPKKYSLNLMK